MGQEKSVKNSLKILYEYLAIAFGAFLAAFAIEEFLVGCQILDGGVVGISIIINNLTEFPLSILTLVLNIPFLIIGSRKLGKKFIVKSGFAMIIFSIALEIFAPLRNMTYEPLLAVCFGGVVLGLGVGIVIRFGGCLDGTETVAILLNKKFNFPVGKTVLMFNIIIYAVAGFLFGADRAMFSLLTYFITSKILDLIENGIDSAKAAMIITNDANELAELIYEKLGRTVTILEGTGLVSGKKKVLYCVISNFEIWELKHIIETIDESAFITISDVSEIIGTHIKSSSEKDKIKEKVNKKNKKNEPIKNENNPK